MLKRSSIRKICLASFCLLILFIIYLFPKVGEKQNNYVPITKTIVTNIKDSVYLIDENNYVAKLNVSLVNDSPKEKALEIIEYLTIGSAYNSLIPAGFRAVIPAGTKVLSSDLNDGNFKINFSNDILKVNAEDEVKMFESLIYSITGIDEIKSVTVLVDGKILAKLPNNKEFLPNPLDRSYGINKKYDVKNIKGTSSTTMYYLSKNNDFYYYIPVTKISNDPNEKIEIIIKELTSSPTHETNLMSYLNSETTLQNYEFLDKKLNLDFNNAILSDVTKNSILEEVSYAINQSIKDNYEVESIQYTVNNKKIATYNLKNFD